MSEQINKQSLKEWRRVHGVTQGQIAEQMGVSIPYISAIERGTKVPSRKAAGLIERITGGAVRAVDLIYPEGLPDFPAVEARAS